MLFSSQSPFSLTSSPFFFSRFLSEAEPRESLFSEERTFESVSFLSFCPFFFVAVLVAYFRAFEVCLVADTAFFS